MIVTTRQQETSQLKLRGTFIDADVHETDRPCVQA